MRSPAALHADDPLEADLRILIPITGTEVSRRGAEVGAGAGAGERTPRRWRSTSPSAATRAARVRRFGGPRRGERGDPEARRWASPNGTACRSGPRSASNIAAEDAILRQARLGGYNLIVMGVTRRPGETLFFGNVATAILESSERSILFVAS